MIKGSLIACVFVALGLTACSAPPKYEWVKEGASKRDQETALSECNYQIKLNKTAVTEQPELLKLCMQGKSYRYKRIN